jgi:hypothetical protein
MDIEATLDLHEKWLDGLPGGVQANFEDKVLQGANLQDANLRRASLLDVGLQRANLRNVDLREADLRGAYLYGANLGGADLSGAYLQEADLRGAYLYRADLGEADLSGAYLQEADLRYADLSGADLRWTDLQGANLSDYHDKLPSTGPFTCYKKVARGTILTLWVPREAYRTAALGTNKCRVSKALVVASTDNKQSWKPVFFTGTDLEYHLGQWAYPDGFNDDIRVSCSNGIHVFMTREEAENW